MDDTRKTDRKVLLSKQTNAFAMHYGFQFGAIWVLTFYLLVSWNETLQFFFTPLFLCTPLIGFYFAYLFKKSVKYDGRVTYLRGLWFSVMLYLFASIVFTIAIYLYFMFLDKGQFIANNIEMMSRPEIKSILTSKEFSQAYGITYKELVDSMKNLSTTDIASAFSNFSLIVALPLAIPTAFFAVTKHIKEQNQN